MKLTPLVALFIVALMLAACGGAGPISRDSASRAADATALALNQEAERVRVLNDLNAQRAAEIQATTDAANAKATQHAWEATATWVARPTETSTATPTATATPIPPTSTPTLVPPSDTPVPPTMTSQVATETATGMPAQVVATPEPEPLMPPGLGQFLPVALMITAFLLGLLYLLWRATRVHEVILPGRGDEDE